MTKTNFAAYQWMNEGTIRFEEDTVIMSAPAKSDFSAITGQLRKKG